MPVPQGRSSKFFPHAQKVSLSHQVQDEDVVSSASFIFLFFSTGNSHLSIHEIMNDLSTSFLTEGT